MSVNQGEAWSCGFVLQREIYNGFYVKFGGNLESVIETIENENSVCVVKSLWRT